MGHNFCFTSSYLASGLQGHDVCDLVHKVMRFYLGPKVWFTSPFFSEISGYGMSYAVRALSNVLGRELAAVQRQSTLGRGGKNTIKSSLTS